MSFTLAISEESKFLLKLLEEEKKHWLNTKNETILLIQTAIDDLSKVTFTEVIELRVFYRVSA